jgi:hypothetical protein
VQDDMGGLGMGKLFAALLGRPCCLLDSGVNE